MGWEGAGVNTFRTGFFQAMQKLPSQTCPWSAQCRAMPWSRQKCGGPKEPCFWISEPTSPTLSSFLRVSPFQLILPLTGHPCLLSTYTHVLANVIVALESPEKPFPLLIEVLPSSPPAEHHLPPSKSISTISGYHKCNEIKSQNSLLNRSPVSL